MKRELGERFWSKVDKSAGPDACWPWTASRKPAGYGQFMREHTKLVNAHAFAFELANGYKPACVRHACDNPPCCNPLHLIPGTKKDNSRDMVRRGRHSEQKLKPTDIPEIRWMLAQGATLRQVAYIYGVDGTMIGHIKAGNTWSCV